MTTQDTINFSFDAETRGAPKEEGRNVTAFVFGGIGAALILLWRVKK